MNKTPSFKQFLIEDMEKEVESKKDMADKGEVGHFPTSNEVIIKVKEALRHMLKLPLFHKNESVFSDTDMMEGLATVVDFFEDAMKYKDDEEFDILDDVKKAITSYYKDGPNSDLPLEDKRRIRYFLELIIFPIIDMYRGSDQSPESIFTDLQDKTKTIASFISHSDVVPHSSDSDQQEIRDVYEELKRLVELKGYHKTVRAALNHEDESGDTSVPAPENE